MNRKDKVRKFVKMTSSLDRLRRAQIQRLCRLYNTPDLRRLEVKLKDPEVMRLYEEGLIVIEDESLDAEEFWRVDLEEVKFDLGKETFLLSYDEIKISYEDVDESIIRNISFSRLDWLWDFGWSYSIWDTKYFPTESLRLYGVIRGTRPKSLHDRPFQLVLNTERKRRIKLWKQRIARAMISERKERVKELLEEPEALFLLKGKEGESLQFEDYDESELE